MTRRTKKDRIKAQTQRKSGEKSRNRSTIIKPEVVDLIHYDTKLIIKDLTKTLIASMVVVGVLVALYVKL